MKIPKKVNAVWDWVSRHRIGVLLWAGWLVGAVLGLAWKVNIGPVLAAFTFGLLVGNGWRSAHTASLREDKRRLKAEVDGLRTKELPPVDPSASAETQRIWPIRGDR